MSLLRYVDRRSDAHGGWWGSGSATRTWRSARAPAGCRVPGGTDSTRNNRVGVDAVVETDILAAMKRCSIVPALLLVACIVFGDGAEMWRGLVVFDEHRCSDYDRGDYPYDQDVEPLIAQNLRGWWSPYDGTLFNDRGESQIDHIVALAEAHDSGLCDANSEMRKQFSSDLDNLALATRSLNSSKGARDAAGWQPAHNRCWFAGRVLAVRLEYGLTIDRVEAKALDAILRECRIEHVLRPLPVP